MARRMNLPPLPALARQAAELERLEALVAERGTAALAAEAAYGAAQEADAAERVNAIRAERKAAPPTAPEAEAARDAAQQESADAQAALNAAMTDVRTQVAEAAPGLLAAIEADQRKARTALRRQVGATRKVLGELEHTEALVLWLRGASAGSVRPFHGGQPLVVPPPSGSRQQFNGGQLLDSLEAMLDLLDAPPAQPVTGPLRVADLRRAG